jgi:tellurite resistance protein
MSDIRSHQKIALESITAFANDGRLDAAELGALAAIARKDGEIDADEARVLCNITNKVTDAELTPEMQATIADLRAMLPPLA